MFVHLGKLKLMKFVKGQLIAHKGTNEHTETVYTGKIIGFNQAAIQIQNDNGATYWLNEWDLVAYPKPKSTSEGLSQMFQVVYDAEGYANERFVSLKSALDRQQERPEDSSTVHLLISTPIPETRFEAVRPKEKCPKCGSDLVEKWSGVQCSNYPKCTYTFCY